MDGFVQPFFKRTGQTPVPPRPNVSYSILKVTPCVFMHIQRITVEQFKAIPSSACITPLIEDSDARIDIGNISSSTKTAYSIRTACISSLQRILFSSASSLVLGNMLPKAHVPVGLWIYQLGSEPAFPCLNRGENGIEGYGKMLEVWYTSSPNHGVRI
jgi:hypothetical protein